MNLMVMDLILYSFCNSLSITSSTDLIDGKLVIIAVPPKLLVDVAPHMIFQNMIVANYPHSQA
ncbi:hypothetical protein T4D_4730 [Trichinella pseudospiralis]|uniref:Uncharacterized protein n=1 Tax=Trichinella pseudospiralis TaxID=6337 RepID=A0A0V1F6S9_TRIPS|nr:hypothetical protein T4D_4730 [Trichinella pseudospiralis]